jgi:hypothetical protein
LVQDPYGNYVVQYVLELGDAHFSDLLIREFIGHLGSLSVQKYSSNVMEKVKKKYSFVCYTRTLLTKDDSVFVLQKKIHADI